MADLTNDGGLRIWKDAAQTAKWILDNSAAQTVFKRGPMIMDLDVDTVYPRMFVDATVVAATDIFLGIAAEGATVATTDTETDNKIEVYEDGSILGWPASAHSYTDADVGDTVYMSDSATLSSTAADNPQIGKLHRVHEGWAFVQIVTPQICTGA